MKDKSPEELFEEWMNLILITAPQKKEMTIPLSLKEAFLAGYEKGKESV